MFDSGQWWCATCRQIRGVTLQQHHVVYQQHIKEVGASRRYLADSRNALSLCRRCHERHHDGTPWTVPLSVLRDENYVFAVELLGPGPAYNYLRRRYAGSDVRLMGILSTYEGQQETAGALQGRSGPCLP